MTRYHKSNDERDTPKKKITRQGLKRMMRLFRFVKPQQGIFIIGLIFLLLSSLTTLVFPALMGDMLDSSTKGTLETINKTGFILIAVFLANPVFDSKSSDE